MHALLYAMAAGFAETWLYVIPATETIISTAPEGQTSDAQYIFNTDGSIQERHDLSIGGTSLTTSASSPWSTDPSEDGVDKYVRLVFQSGGGDRRTDSIGDGWVLLTSQRIYVFQNSGTEGPYSDATVYKVDISLDGSTIHDTQDLTVNLDNAGP